MTTVLISIVDKRDFQDPDGELTPVQMVDMMVGAGVYLDLDVASPHVTSHTVMMDGLVMDRATADLMLEAAVSCDPIKALAACRAFYDATYGVRLVSIAA